MKSDKFTLAELRKNYKYSELLENSVNKNPVDQFDLWMSEAVESEIEEPNAMTLATANENGIPSARIVLLKDVNEKGFVFFTNYDSRKGKELTANPHAALVFLWKELERQIRIEGTVEKLPAEASSIYFSSRPKESQIGALVSAQSSIITDRIALDSKLIKLTEEYKDTSIPRPDFWGGFVVISKRIEFWQGRPNRLHDRILYTKTSENDWNISRLSP